MNDQRSATEPTPLSELLIIRPADLARRLSVSEATLRRMEADGEIPSRRKISKRVTGFLRVEIENWLAKMESGDE